MFGSPGQPNYASAKAGDHQPHDGRGREQPRSLRRELERDRAPRPHAHDPGPRRLRERRGGRRLRSVRTRARRAARHLPRIARGREGVGPVVRGPRPHDLGDPRTVRRAIVRGRNAVDSRRGRRPPSCRSTTDALPSRKARSSSPIREVEPDERAMPRRLPRRAASGGRAPLRSEAEQGAGRMTTAALDVRPFVVDIPQADLDDLHERLARTRFPERSPTSGWDYGTELAYARELVDVLARHVRLARGRGAAERVRPVHRPTSTAPTSTSSTSARPSPTRSRCHHARLAGLGRRVPRGHRPAHRSRARTAAIRPTRSTSSRRRCPATRSPGRRTSAAGTRGRIATAWADAHGRPRLRALRRAGRRLGRDDHRRSSAPSDAAARRRHPPQHGASRPRRPAPTRRRSPRPSSAALGDMRRTWSDDAGYMQIQATKPQTLGYALKDSPAGARAPGSSRSSAPGRDCDGDVESSFTQRPAAHQRDALLAHRHRALVGAPLLREPHSPGTSRSAARVDVPTGRRDLPEARSSGRRAPGWSTATTSRTGPRCRAAVTSRRWRSRSSSSTTSARSSVPCAEPTTYQEATWVYDEW